MEHSGIQQGARRKANEMYDPDDNTEISSSKKIRAEPELEKKKKCLKFILKSYESIHELAAIPTIDPHYRNINIANAIINCIFSSFNIQRQEANGIEGNAKKKSDKTKNYTITSKGTVIPIPVQTIHDRVKAAANSQGLQFLKFGLNDKENWYGTAAPYLCFFSANSMRIKEIRVGNGNMPFEKSEDKTKAFPVGRYGLNEGHHILLEGSSYPPERRSAMAQTLGPMTAHLLHVRTEEKYRRKWTDATKKAMAHVPFIDEILEVVRGKKASEIAGLTSTVADILRIASSRQANRMFFPINLLYVAATLPIDSNTNKILNERGEITDLLGGEEIIKNFNVSGSGGYYLYKISCLTQFEMEGNFSQAQAQQLLFHSIFGTYKEDLTVLEQVTDCGNWITREEFGKSFQEMTTCGKSVSFRPINIKMYSKLANANMTGLLTSNYGQTSSIPVFSGSRRQHFREDFFEQLSKRTNISAAGKNIPQLTAALLKVLSDLQDHLEKNGRNMDMGTVIWRDIGTQFNSICWDAALERWQTQHWTTPVYHPRANLVERRNQEIKKDIRARLQGLHPTTWDRALPQVLFNLRTRANAATGVTPSQALLGYELSRPGDWNHGEDGRPPARDLAARSQLIRSINQHQQRYRQRYTQTGEKPGTCLQKGQQVMVRSRRQGLAACTWEGPFHIADIVSSNVYWVDKHGQMVKEHYDNIRPYPVRLN